MHACMSNGTSAHPRKSPRAKRSEGARLLEKWREKRNLDTWVAAGEALGVPWHRYRRWELGECVPLMGDSIMIEKKTGIEQGAWLR